MLELESGLLDRTNTRQIASGRRGLLTGCRYSELTRLRVSAFNADSSTIAIRLSKGKIHRFQKIQPNRTECPANRGPPPSQALSPGHALLGCRRNCGLLRARRGRGRRELDDDRGAPDHFRLLDCYPPGRDRRRDDAVDSAADASAGKAAVERSRSRLTSLSTGSPSWPKPC
jgi:hypothetical protein